MSEPETLSMKGRDKEAGQGYSNDEDEDDFMHELKPLRLTSPAFKGTGSTRDPSVGQQLACYPILVAYYAAILDSMSSIESAPESSSTRLYL